MSRIVSHGSILTPTARRLFLSLFLAAITVLTACGGSAPKPDPVLIEQASRLAAQGSRWYNLGCYLRAQRYFFQAMETSRLLDDVAGIIQARNNLGASALAMGRFGEAAEHLQKALTLCRDVKNTPEESLVYGNLASLAYKAGRTDDAEKMWRQAVAVAGKLEGKPGLALHLSNLGALQRKKGRLDEAEATLREAQAEAIRADQIRVLAGIHLQLGQLTQARGDMTGAERHLTLALDLDKDAENPRGIAQDLEALGRHYQARKMWEQAANVLDRAAYLRAALADRKKVEQIVRLLETNHAQSGRPESLEPYRQLLKKNGDSETDLLCR